jgi:cation transport ATPase
MTNEQHNKYVAYSFFGFAAFQLFWLVVMSLFFVFFFTSIPSQPGQPGPPPFALFGVMFAFMFVIQFMFTAPSIIAGWAMLRHKPWARIASIIAAVLSAMSVPIGTAACVYSLWFWLGDNWKEVYPEGEQGHGRSSPGLSAGDDFSTTHDFVRSEEWIREPPDWR